ncbi:MAG: hypothetical protein A3G33_02740 [Omnitrophica bacterium RIFCSPLOWO2_12_FULL_44_17]|uniref:Methyltransferase domain-containing protein n=1 Tax=Candidatus Danuiimicrobium aquiferis TaxID=1801832 RepID=A0A1G1KYB1_9BACT|nr:MAG: hypothetical protein A3E74_06090 [Omnitrophica bacterium RIFCSPHIGHO2_12_FULL_44_12]OGW97900.1 MAG: hypothetical protein A3G33_02740 [Omnitrophica bacterium RIFCSPLOWO2_12_FULL_44_17]OGX02833.1 MAG: hypothetical protein A3J12_00135 [Omnitrophica bacterium RIFCSPLOWO2_02_FULL_44_11]
MKLKQQIDDFVYKKIIRSLLLTSCFGRKSVLGRSESGVNFEYMYDNKSHGYTWLGKLVDRILLNLPAVKATRNRKDSILKILKNEIKDNIIREIHTKIVDIGSGGARYIRELKDDPDLEKYEAVCVDYDSESVSLAKGLIKPHPELKSSLRFLKADAFKLNHLEEFAKKIKWTPNVIIASGFIYYLDDGVVKKVLSEIYRQLAPNGLLIMSNIKQSPSQKLMERVCTMQGSRPWVVYYRDPEVLRTWLMDVGFQFVVIGEDAWGMYNICTARKVK